MLTAKDIIKILPLDPDFKADLYLNFDTMQEDARAQMVDILWNAYDAYYQLKLNSNIQQALAHSLEEPGSEKLDSKFYERMVEKTEEELIKEQGQEESKFDLDEAQNALKDIMQKIKESQ